MSESGAISLNVDGDKVAWLSFDLPESSVNLLSSAVMADLDARLSELESRIATGQPIGLVITSGKPGTFIAGADVSEIADLENAEDARHKAARGQRIFRRLERLPVPTFAAIDGVCVGGGTELALACDYRIASDSRKTRIGLPEVKLGIIPGFGGTVRLPRLIGLQRALRMILTGSLVSASRALKMGLVDRVARADRFREEVSAFAREVLRGSFRRSERSSSLKDRILESTGFGRRIVFGAARKQALKESGGHYPAPLEAIDVVEQTLDLPVDQALPVEAAALGRMAATDVSRALVRLFLLQQAARRALPEQALEERTEVERAAVLGAGVMGGAIAELLAAHDIGVILKDIEQSALDVGLSHAHDLLKKAGEKGVMSTDEVGLKFALIHGTLEYEKFDDAQLVIEAVVERLPVKQQVLRETEDVLSEAAVFATNTSSLSVTELARASKRPERVVGLHFFNPVHKMPLVEVVRAKKSSDEALAMAFGLALDVGKTPVLVSDRPGFLVNRLLAPYLNEASYLLEEGVRVETLDRALTEFGMPMGPARLLDEVGFDVAEHVAREMRAAFGERMEPAGVVKLLREEGRLGRKNGRGFYTYTKGRASGVDRDVARTLAGASEGDPISADEIRERCLYPIVNEAMRALEEGVVRSPGDVDLAMVMGTGFPPFRGGLLYWADSVGADAIVEALEQYEQRYGMRFAPSEPLERAARSGRNLVTEPSEE